MYIVYHNIISRDKNSTQVSMDFLVDHFQLQLAKLIVWPFETSTVHVVYILQEVYYSTCIQLKISLNPINFV